MSETRRQTARRPGVRPPYGSCCRSVQARGYAPLRGAAFRNVGAANFNPPAGRLQILNSPFSILNSAAGRRPGVRPPYGSCCRSVRARGYAPARGAAFRNVGAAYFNPPAGRPQILNSPFSIFNSAAGRRPGGRPPYGSVSCCLLPAAYCPFHPSPAGASSLRAEERPDRREK